MKIIITGGAGFIGSHLIEKLIRSKKIKKIILIDNFEDGNRRNISKIVKHKKLKIVKSDITNINSIRKYFKGINAVIHLAAIADIVPSIENPKNYINTNFNGTINILESMRYYGVKKIIYAASSSCYGIPKKYPTDEKEKISPEYPYAFSKYVGELAIQHWAKIYKLNYISLRLFNVYGTRSRTHGAYGAVMGVFLKQKLSNKPYTIVGDGKQTRDFIFVSDVVNAFEKALFSSKKNKIYNVGANNPKSINELVSILEGKKIFIPKRPGEPKITNAKIKKIKRELNWRPKISLSKGIKLLLKDINYWSNAPLWTPQKISKATKVWFKFLRK